MQITLSPEFPSANETITAKIEFYSIDLQRTNIIWSINGEIKKETIGGRDFSFRTKDLGEIIVLKVDVYTPNSELFTRQININPTDIDLIWEAETYTPTFYKGKALNTHESVIKIVALPNFIDASKNKIDPKNLIYKWKKDLSVQGEKSGYAKNTLSFIGPSLLRENIITVEIESMDGKIKGRKLIIIEAQEPEIIFYENDPLLGIKNNLSIENNFNLKSGELKLIAQPFFFSLTSGNNIQYEWIMNGNIINNNTNKIILKKPEEIKGLSTLSLRIQDITKIFQFAENDLNINFN
ncbi:MAG: hypothetical protein KAR54_01230 [Candidatus Pacebacteria bacterium]|nr:hypothetical protein [Candidatus Paceibacterota bacterium]